MQVLEGLLREWEDLCFLMRIQVKMYERENRYHGIAQSIIDGPLSHWSEFRKYLNDFDPQKTFDRRRFCGETNQTGRVGLSLNAPLLAGWAAHSRRVFQVNEAVQEKLESIDPGRMLLSDLTWPLDSFGISFEKPVFKFDGYTYRFALVSNYKDLLYPERDQNQLAIAFLPDWMRKYYGIRQEKREKARKYFEAGKQTKVMAVLDKYVERLLNREDSGVKTWQCSPNKNIKINTLTNFDQARDKGYVAGREQGFSLKKASREGVDVIFKACEAVLNLVIFLETIGGECTQKLPEGVPPAEERPEQNRGKSLTTSSDVFEVDNEHIVQSVNRLSVPGNKSDRELRPHWRRGHKRRPPGKGDDPTAEKTVEVSPTLVRGDKLGEENIITVNSNFN